MDGLGRWLFLYFFTPQDGERRGFSYYVEIQQKECERRGKEQGSHYSKIKMGKRKRGESHTISRVLLHDFHDTHNPWGFAI